MTALVCGLLTVALLVYIFYPESRVATQAEKSRTEFLLERKDALYENLRDLNFEYRVGKYRDEEYELERATLENEAAIVLGEIELLENLPQRTSSNLIKKGQH